MSNRPVLVRFGFLRQKLVQTGVAWFSWFWLGFFLVFFGFGSFFWFFDYKTETEPNRQVFSIIFFSGFLNLISFLVFCSLLDKNRIVERNFLVYIK
jgi:hypothetical protein